MNNVDVRLAAKGAGIPLWQIASKMGISEPTMSRKLREPLSEEDKQQILTIISDLQKEGRSA